jgi:hypothetical protein
MTSITTGGMSEFSRHVRDSFAGGDAIGSGSGLPAGIDRWQSGVGGSSAFARLAGYVNQGGVASKVAKLWQVIGFLTLFSLLLFCCKLLTFRYLHPAWLEPATL